MHDKDGLNAMDIAAYYGHTSILCKLSVYIIHNFMYFELAIETDLKIRLQMLDIKIVTDYYSRYLVV